MVILPRGPWGRSTPALWEEAHVAGAAWAWEMGRRGLGPDPAGSWELQGEALPWGCGQRRAGPDLMAHGRRLLAATGSLDQGVGDTAMVWAGTGQGQESSGPHRDRAGKE